MMKWRQRFMDLALHIAAWSKDPSTKVGAVIVNDLRQVIGLGYNGFPRGVNDDDIRYTEKMVKYSLVVHSEANAILNANGRVAGCILYATKFPCSGCAKLIIQSGISAVITVPPSSDSPWSEDAEFSMQMFREVGTIVAYLENGELRSAVP